MIILEIDTDALRSAVAVAKQTNDAITEASNLLNQIVLHNDWACRERYQINEYTMSNREKAAKLRGNATSFYQAIERSSQQFDEEEQKSIQWANALDGLLGEIFQIVPGMSGGSGNVSITSFDNFESLKK